MQAGWEGFCYAIAFKWLFKKKKKKRSSHLENTMESRTVLKLARIFTTRRPWIRSGRAINYSHTAYNEQSFPLIWHAASSRLSELPLIFRIWSTRIRWRHSERLSMTSLSAWEVGIKIKILKALPCDNGHYSCLCNKALLPLLYLLPLLLKMVKRQKRSQSKIFQQMTKGKIVLNLNLFHLISYFSFINGQNICCFFPTIFSSRSKENVFCFVKMQMVKYERIKK